MTVGYLDDLAQRARKFYESAGEKVISVTIDIGKYPSSIVINCKGGIMYSHTVEDFEEFA